MRRDTSPVSVRTVVVRSLLVAATAGIVALLFTVIMGGPDVRYVVSLASASAMGAVYGLIRYRGIDRR